MRVVSLHPTATELVFALGAGGSLVARTDECIFPESASRIPSIGRLNKIGKDSIAILEPTLVLTGPGQDASEFALLWDVVKVAPRTMNEVYDIIKDLGARLSKPVEADMIIHDLRITLERVAQKTERFHKAKVVCEHNGQRADIFILELLSLAGGEPYLGEYAAEGIKQFDPRYILVLGDDELAHTVEHRPGWEEVGAVRNEMVLHINEELLRPTPRLVEGVKTIAKILHGVDINGV